MTQLRNAPVDVLTPPSRHAIFVRGLMAAAAALVLVIGAPVALLTFAGNPLPDEISLSALPRLLSEPDIGGAVFLHTMAIVGWLAWASLFISIVVEVIAVLRQRPAPRLGAAFSVQQQFAAGLIAAITLLFFAPVGVAAAAAPDATSPAPSAVSADAVVTATSGPASAESSRTAPSSQPVSAKQAQAPLYTVQHGDTLWSVAEAHLGDGSRYGEIAVLNTTRVQPDGDRLDDSHWLRPGWILQLPADARTSAPTPENPALAGAAPTSVRVVAPGESIWSIADDLAGLQASDQDVAELSQHIIELSRPLQQPGGTHLQDPDLIRPGWQLTAAPAPSVEVAAVPAAAPAAPPAPAEAAIPEASNAAPAAAPTSAVPLTSPAPAVPSSAPAARAPHAPQASGTPTSSAPSPTATSSATSSSAATASTEAAQQIDTDDAAEDGGWPLRTVGGVSALLAAGVLSLLAARRSRQQRRRRPGQRIAMPSQQDEITELELRAVENSHAVRQVDTALRGLSLWLHEHGQPLPAVNFARLSADRFQLHLAEPVQLPAPWMATSDSTVWALACDPEDPDALNVPPRADGTPVQAHELAQVPAPYPSLVVIGQDLDGTHVLLDLEQLVAISIKGDIRRSEQILRALAIELATSTWADDLRVTLVDCCAELPEALNTLRVRHLNDVDELLRDLEGHTRSTSEVLRSGGADDVTQARAQHVATDASAPEIVLLATAISSEQRDRLDRVLNDHPRLGIAAVTAGAHPDIDSWTLTLDDPDAATRESEDMAPTPAEEWGTATLEELSLRIVPQRIDDVEYESILNLLRASTADASNDEITVMPVEHHLDDLPAVSVLPQVDSYRDLSHKHIDLREHPYDDHRHDDDAHTDHVVLGEEGSSAPEPISTSHDEMREDDVHRGDPVVTRVALDPEATAPAAGPRVKVVDEPTTRIDVQPSHAATGSSVPVPTGLPPATDAAGASEDISDDAGDGANGVRAEASVTRLHPPLLRVLGTVDVINTHGQAPDDRGRLGRGLELAILLGFFPGLDHRGVDAKLSPNKRIATATRNKWSWAIRKLLGTDENGDDYIPKFSESTGFRYHLHPQVRTDWHLFQELAEDRSTTSKLKALRLVRGAPFSGIDPRRYTWSEGLHQEIVSAIVDVAFEVAERALTSGNPELAREAAAIGRLAEPGSQVLWRATLRADYLLNDHDALSEHAERLSETNDDDLEPETTQLLGELLQGPPARAGAR